MIHLPVNLDRLILNCKQIFDMRLDYGMRSLQKSDLNPIYVVEQVKKLTDSLTIFPGRNPTKIDKYIAEANTNATKLAKIYIR